MTLRRSILVSLAAAAILAIVPATASACDEETTYAAELSEPQLEASVTCLINERRADGGRPSVRPNSRLRHAALNHTSDMVSVGFFSHNSPDGTGFVDRIESSGYMRGARLWLVGENLVWGTGELSTPAKLVEAWMQSPPHRANLMRGRFKEVGVGVVRGTPTNASELDGVTVASEYGFRVRPRGANRARR